MGIMIACGVLATAAVVAGVGWGGHRFVAPDLEDVLTSGEVARRFVWYLSLVFTAGIAAGVSVIGAGGRLAMRLLAVTAGDSAQGRLTEAERIVGTITVDGTIDFVVFNGIFGGLIAATLYLLVRRLLPPGRLGGIAFGLGLLIVFGATIDPLRKANPDFAIVGPTWLAVLVFAAMSVVFGLAMHGLMSRASEWLPLPAANRQALRRYLVPGLVAVVAFSITAVAIAVGAVAVAVTRWPPVVRVVRSSRWVIGGRVAMILIVLASLPNLLSNTVDILPR